MNTKIKIKTRKKTIIQRIKQWFLQFVSKRKEVFIVNYYMDGRQYFEGAYSSNKLARQWINKQEDSICYLILVMPLDVC